MAPTPALVALFNAFVAGSGGLHVARLYTITPAGGLPIRFTDADFDILGFSTSALVNGFTYSSGGLRVDQKASKTQAHLKIGTDTDSWTLVIMPRPFDAVTGAAFPDKIGSLPFLQAVSGGALDAADFQVDEAYFSAVPKWPIPPGGVAPVGCRTLFAGSVAEVDIASSVAVLTVNDYRALFSIQMPLHFYQGQCRHTLFDAGCTLVPASYGYASVAAAAGSTSSALIGTGLAAPPGGAFALGKVVMSGGLNAGFSRTIKSWDGAFTVQLLNPLPFTVAAGDTFTIYPGCDKTLASCGRFGNTANYGGFPYIPPPETQG